MMHNNKKIKLLFTGGGTGGSVSPLLAIVDVFRQQTDTCLPAGRGNRQQDYFFYWVGTKDGPEIVMVEKEGITFKAIASGKLRRYWSWQNLIDPFNILIGLFQAFFILLDLKPNLVISAGGFVSVPVVWMAWILRIPIIIHQQDVRPGLANKLMAPFAKIITVSFEKSLQDYGSRAVWIGNPVRREFTDDRSLGAARDRQTTDNRQQTLRQALFESEPQSRGQGKTTEFLASSGRDQGLEMRDKETTRRLNDLPTILIVGGSTGAEKLNLLIKESVAEITKFAQIIHITGKGKDLGIKHENYQAFEFLNVNQMAKVLNLADVIISRSGMNMLTELSYLGKPSIIIPLPETHQEENAAILKDKNAAIVLSEKYLDKNIFIVEVKKLILDNDLQKKLSANMAQVIKRGAGDAIVKIIDKMLN